eukprot:tig00000361_g24414.t1
MSPQGPARPSDAPGGPLAQLGLLLALELAVLCAHLAWHPSSNRLAEAQGVLLAGVQAVILLGLIALHLAYLFDAGSLMYGMALLGIAAVLVGQTLPKLGLAFDAARWLAGGRALALLAGLRAAAGAALGGVAGGVPGELAARQAQEAAAGRRASAPPSVADAGPPRPRRRRRRLRRGGPRRRRRLRGPPPCSCRTALGAELPLMFNAFRIQRRKPQRLQPWLWIQNQLQRAQQYLSDHCEGTAASGNDILLTIRGLHLDHVGSKGDRHPALRNFNAALKGGNLVLILGAPGAGKTSLLQTLAGNAKSSGLEVRGEILLNGVPQEGAMWKRQCALVEQEDLHFPTLTVRETLYFSARSRLPAHFSDDQINSRVSMCLELLNLKHAQDTIIGNASIRGVSGGERRRVSIGVEGVVGAPILLMDEPSTGLDASSTLDLCRCARAMADSGHIVVMSLLQPSYESYSLFDRVILLGHGHVAYNGPGGDEPVRHFEGLGYRIPSHVNAADFLQAVIEPSGREYFVGCRKCVPSSVHAPAAAGLAAPAGAGADPDRGPSPAAAAGPGDVLHPNVPLTYAGFAHAFEQSSTALEEQAKLEELARGPAARRRPAPGQLPGEYGAGFPLMFWLCLVRQLRLLYRDKIAVAFRLGCAIGMGFMLGTLFANLPATITGGSYRMSIIFFGVAGISWQATATIPKAFQERAVFYRQQRAGYFRTSAYFLAHIAHELHFFFLEALFFSLIAYFPPNLQRVDGGQRFGIFLAGMFLTRIMSDGAMKIVTSVFRDVRSGSTFGPAVLSVLFLFNGFLVPRDNIPRPWIWMHYLDFMKYPIEALAINEMHDLKYDLPVPGSMPVPPPPAGVAPVMPEWTGQLSLKQFQLETDREWIWRDLVICVGFYVLLQFLGYLALKVRSRAISSG